MRIHAHLPLVVAHSVGSERWHFRSLVIPDLPIAGRRSRQDVDYSPQHVTLLVGFEAIFGIQNARVECWAFDSIEALKNLKRLSRHLRRCWTNAMGAKCSLHFIEIHRHALICRDRACSCAEQTRMVAMTPIKHLMD